MSQVADRFRAKFFARALSLSPRTVRLLAGKPVRIDGLTLSPQSQLMLKLQRLSFERGAETLPIKKGRVAMNRHAAIAGGVQPIGETHETEVPGAEGPLAARMYVPRALVGADLSGGAPLLMFFHGGGMIYGDLESHDAVCRFLAEQSGVRVLAVDYRLAPEHPFPAAPDDAWAAYEWVVKNPGHYDADPQRLAIGGDSAGGALTAVTAIRAAERGVPLAFQLLIYPATDMAEESRSRSLFGRNLYLTTEFMRLSDVNYIADADHRDPRISVMYADLPDGLAPAFVATAGFDPLRDEGEAYARKLGDAGVPVQFKRYGGEIHGFINLLGVDGVPRRAAVEMAHAVRDALH